MTAPEYRCFTENLQVVAILRMSIALSLLHQHTIGSMMLEYQKTFVLSDRLLHLIRGLAGVLPPRERYLRKPVSLLLPSLLREVYIPRSGASKLFSLVLSLA